MAKGSFRYRDRISIMVSSATQTALQPGMLETEMPFSEAAAMSILSSPTPHFWICLAALALAIRFAVTGNTVAIR
ncbi:hypothetical protein D3C75_1118390 [compost metagenome]